MLIHSRLYTGSLYMTKLKISHRALIQRINRKLKPGGTRLRVARNEWVELDVGRYFIVDANQSAITLHHVDLEELGRTLGVMCSWETLEPGAVDKRPRATNWPARRTADDNRDPPRYHEAGHAL